PGTPFPTEVGKDIFLPLQISSEPRLNAHDALDLRAERAVDDRGRLLPVHAIRVELADDQEDTFRRFNGRNLPPPPPARKSGPGGGGGGRGAGWASGSSGVMGGRGGCASWPAP